jgi:hypothetical protein
MIKNISFEYADHVLPDKERERFLANQARLWFEPLIDEINKESGTIDFFLKEGFENRVSFNGFTEDLNLKMMERWKLFQIPQRQ